MDTSPRLEASLVELVKVRASQVDGCAYCLAMHARDVDGIDHPVAGPRAGRG